MLYELVTDALDQEWSLPCGFGATEPEDQRDALLTLLAVHDLTTAPLSRVRRRVRWQGHPAIAALKWRLEDTLEAHLDGLIGDDRLGEPVAADEVADLMRSLAARDRCPPIYQWLAEHATWQQLVHFMAVEGGPDAGFDDLVAITQVGITGPAKVVLAHNYWDEMGRGRLEDVHTVLHDDLVAAVDMPHIARRNLPLPALQRAALGGLLATNRRLQPEMLGALGLLELQAGPRCRLVVKALRRLGAPAEALPFYEVHASIDPRHGKEWLEQAVVPLVEHDPTWGPGVIRGALWRSAVNEALFEHLHDTLTAQHTAA